MRIINTFLIMFLLSNFVYAKTIAVCEKLEGHVYYPYIGLIQKKDSGWFKDKISNGITQLEMDENGVYDIQFVDAMKQIVSATKDGGKVIPFAISDNKIGVTTIYPGNLVETYGFFRENNGKLTYTMTQTKINTPVPKATAMKGTCSFINFNEAK